nr:hypothetical protein BaRGS_030262 [Batillaria attramentaria]
MKGKKAARLHPFLVGETLRSCTGRPDASRLRSGDLLVESNGTREAVAGFYWVKVKAFIPLPLRCFKCQSDHFPVILSTASSEEDANSGSLEPEEG